MYLRLLVLAGLLIGCGNALSMPDPAEVDPYILRVLTHRNSGDQPLSGTGFVIQGTQVVITNYHVIDGAKDIVVLNSARKDELLPARVLKTSKVHDIALLAVAGLSGSGLLLSPREEPAKGQSIWAIGYPGAADRGRVDLNAAEATLTQGIVNRTLYQPWEEGGPVLSIIQHDAKLSHGNSGGPLLDSCAQVVGVNTQIELAAQALETYNYALSAAELRTLLNSWGISYGVAEKPCTPVAGAADERLVWWSVAIALGLAAAALVLAWRSSGKRLVKAMGNHSRFRGRPANAGAKRARFGSLGAGACGQTTLTLQRATSEVLCVLSCPTDQSRQWTLGRNSALSDQVIDNDTVSRRHVRVLWQSQNSRWYVEDLNSSNGTWLDGRALQAYEPIALYPGARLTLGELQLTVANDARSI